MVQINRNKKGLYTKFLIRMYDKWVSIPSVSRKDYLTYANFREIICRGFSITSQEAMEYLYIFQEFEYLSIEKRGIKLCYEVIDG